jgi:hypothetical protein
VPNISPCALVDLASGAARTLSPSVAAKPGFLGPHSATFSPDGTEVLYTYAAMDNPYPGQLALRATHGGPESLLRYTTGKFVLGGDLDIGLGLNWAGNNTIFVATAPNQGMLFTIRRG